MQIACTLQGPPSEADPIHAPISQEKGTILLTEIVDMTLETYDAKERHGRARHHSQPRCSQKLYTEISR